MLKKTGIEIDHRWVVMDQPVKALGKYEVQVKLGSGVSATCKFFVVSKAK
jgi:large subunit ribosomal protein L9